MRITDCRADWTEDANFSFSISSAGNQYVFIHFLSRAKLHAPYCDIDMPSGACILFDKHVPLRISFSKKTARFGWFFLQGDLTAEVEKYNIEYNRIYYPDNADITQILRSAEKALLTKHSYFEDMSASKVRELMLALTQSKARPQPLVNSDTNLEKLRTAMIANCTDTWTMPQMSALAKLPQSTLIKQYKQIYGIPPKDDLSAMRIQHAKFMLLTQKLPLKEIASRLGFSSASAFSKCFKLHTGILPSMYKHSL